MGRWSTYPTTVESCITLSISDLKRLGFLGACIGVKSCNVNTSRNEQVIASYRITVDSNIYSPSIKFSYNCDDEEIHYTIKMIAVESNLGKGLRYYFVCPNTNEQCIKLYKPPREKYFLHRKAFKLVYQSQLKSKFERSFDSVLGSALKIEKEYEKNYTKWSKTHYKGEPTKWYVKLNKMEHKASLIDPRSLMDLF